VDIERFLTAISDDAPCGPNPEYDPDYGEFMRAAQGKPEQVFGEKKIPAEAPDWAAVRERAPSLFQRSKDLRVAVTLTRALVVSDGVTGLADGLELIHEMLARFWEHVHPQLDPDDDQDPTMRLNALAPLVHSEQVLRDFRRCPFLRSRSLGQLLVRDVEVAFGKASSSEEEAACSPERAEALARAAVEEGVLPAEAVRRALAASRAIHNLLIERLGAERALDLRPLTAILATLQKLCDRVSAADSTGTDAEAEGVSEAETDAAREQPQAGAAAKITGNIRSRDEAQRMLDKVCEYLERNEPSSPAPLLIKRARRLIGMSFVDVLLELSPDSMAQVEAIAGIRREQQ